MTISHVKKQKIFNMSLAFLGSKLAGEQRVLGSGYLESSPRC